MPYATLLCLVVAITDGNTLTARCGEPPAQVQVRLIGIDAPAKRQPHGTRARAALEAITLGKTAELRCQRDFDIQPQRLCSAWVAPASAPDGPRTLDAGLALLTLGMAWRHRDPAAGQSPQERGQYEFAEQEARARRAGLWSDAKARHHGTEP